MKEHSKRDVERNQTIVVGKLYEASSLGGDFCVLHIGTIHFKSTSVQVKTLKNLANIC